MPGKSGESPLIERIAGTDPDLRMPPKGELLDAPSVAAIRSWIDQGAKWPTGTATAAPKANDHWSLKPLVRPPVPAEPKGGTVRNPIDAFVLARLGERPFPIRRGRTAAR